MDNIKRVSRVEPLVIAGLFIHNGDVRGNSILNVATVEEAERLTNSDPATQAGTLTMDLHPWYGKAGSAYFTNGVKNRKGELLTSA